MGIRADKKILDAIRVLDFTRMLSGPYATRILADFGAEVIKIQSKKTARGAEQNETGYFNTWNRNKRSVTLDLDHPEARDLVLKLAAISDVVVENYSPRVMANWGLTYERLKRVKPDLIMESISAMGQTGPWKDYIGFAPTFHALSGLIDNMSHGLSEPVCPGHAYGDTIIGLYGALAILAALEHRDRTGQGEYIDLSGYEALCTFLGPALLKAAQESESIDTVPARWDSIPTVPYGCYPCEGDDRWCAIAIFTDGEWMAFCNVVERPELRDDRFSTLAKRRKHQSELDRLIGLWTITRPAEDVVDLLQKSGIAAGVVQNAKDLAEDEQLASRDFYISLNHPLLGKTISDRSALLCQWYETKDWKASPLLGEANNYVLSDLLGFSVTEIENFAERGIIG
jgi:crotonobetainyl-CoA:carnitine CoA-transferase CaiB-like acyl-CoA transferase